ncbi:MAG: hypothetical protein MUP55_01555 [Candidatus Aenigmarchaeota archaeon]|nr:hypothetical protein [Candidatus Aenigmarchaeota archaeon]
MVIIIRKDMEIRGNLFKNVKTYEPGGYMTKEDKERAENIDKKIAEEFKNMESDFKKKGLLYLKGKKQKVVELWWEVGKRLSFIDEFGLDEDERRLIWVAMYYHGKNLAPGPPGKRVRRSPETSHFSYCYKLGKFPKEVALSQDWTAWSEFFDSEVIKNDTRIIEWLNKKVKDKFPGGSRQNWLRELTKVIRNRFKNIDTASYRKKEELEKELETIFKEIY